MKRAFALSVTAVLLTVTSLVNAAPVGAGGSDTIKVMTRNQYIGTDLTPLILAQTPQEFLAAAAAALTQIAANNFPRRAKGFAREVFLTRPHAIGLQEVYDLTLNGQHVGPPFVDHLEATLDALAKAGLHYEVAGIVEHQDVTLLFDVDGDTIPDAVRVLDRDVILVQVGLAHTALGGTYPTGLCGFPIPNPVPGAPLPDTLQSTPAQDGCTYTVVAQVNSPVGTLTLKRGFLGVDVTMAGKTYRIVTTHLEPPLNQGAAFVQFLQSVELAGTLLATTPPGLALITVGDFNSSPLDLAAGPIVPPYQVMTSSGFVDAWDTNLLAFLDPDGFTCCQDSDLANTTSLLDTRIDLVFVRHTSPFQSLAAVTGRVPLFPLSVAPNWASDHAGVFAKLTFP